MPTHWQETVLKRCRLLWHATWLRRLLHCACLL